RDGVLAQVQPKRSEPSSEFVVVTIATAGNVTSPAGEAHPLSLHHIYSRERTLHLPTPAECPRGACQRLVGVSSVTLAAGGCDVQFHRFCRGDPGGRRCRRRLYARAATGPR